MPKRLGVRTNLIMLAMNKAHTQSTCQPSQEQHEMFDKLMKLWKSITTYNMVYVEASSAVREQ